MSAKLLSMDPKYRHRFVDELESMLYVTLYCCVRWIPHNVLWRLGSLVRKFFFSFDYVLDVKRGDMEKVWEARTERSFTGKFDFPFKPVQQWISDMYDLLGPFCSSRESNWNEDSVERLWRGMVCLDLPDGDRVDHQTYGLLGETPRPYEGTKTMQVNAQSSSSSKRSYDESDDSESDRSSKRRRQDYDDGEEFYDDLSVDGVSVAGEADCEHSKGEGHCESSKTTGDEF